MTSIRTALSYLFSSSLAMSLAFASPTYANAAEIGFRSLCCDKTTEDGADEVYVLAVAVRSDGKRFYSRLPNDAPHESHGHWDMNDGNQQTDNPSGDAHCRTNKTLLNVDIAPGQSLVVSLLFMEEDGGTSQNFQEFASKLLIETQDPIAVGAGALLGLLTHAGFFINDTDDFIGSCGARISNTEGKLDVNWESMDRVHHSIPDPADPSNRAKREFCLVGDGSIHKVWVYAR